MTTTEKREHHLYVNQALMAQSCREDRPLYGLYRHVRPSILTILVSNRVWCPELSMIFLAKAILSDINIALNTGLK